MIRVPFRVREVGSDAGRGESRQKAGGSAFGEVILGLYGVEVVNLLPRSGWFSVLPFVFVSRYSVFRAALTLLEVRKLACACRPFLEYLALGTAGPSTVKDVPIGEAARDLTDVALLSQ